MRRLLLALLLLALAGRVWAQPVPVHTELPAPATRADNMPNPSVPAVAAHLMCYDGATWDRCGSLAGTEYDQGTATTATDKVTMSGAIRRDTPSLDAGVAN